MLLLFLCLLNIFGQIFPNAEIVRNATVQTSLGQVLGKIRKSSNGAQYMAFLAIPYATQQSRFAKPGPPQAWEGTYDASEYQMRCVPENMTEESENCHFVKILSPENQTGLCPVLFWPPGGGFTSGTSFGYDDDALANILISKGVIIAQPEYRGGPFGFWSTGTPEAPGNYAIWDAIEALKWVKKEIQAFGGDPNKIICMGQGAGSILCDMLSLSPLTQHQFAGVSMWSGTMLSPRVNRDDQKNLRDYLEFAREAGCGRTGNLSVSDLNSQVVQCLRQKAPQELADASDKTSKGADMFWHPRPDGEIWPHGSSLEQLAKQRQGSIPVFTGTTVNLSN